MLEVLAAGALLWLAMVPLIWVDYQAERDRQREARLRELVDHPRSQPAARRRPGPPAHPYGACRGRHELTARAGAVRRAG